MGGEGSVARHCVESSIECFALLGLGQTWTQLVLWLRLPRCLAAWCGVYAFITGLVPVTISCWHRLCRIASHTHTHKPGEREREGETLRRTSCRCCYGSFFSNVFATYRTATPTHTHTLRRREFACGSLVMRRRVVARSVSGRRLHPLPTCLSLSFGLLYVHVIYAFR